jgi:hypothetical protein
MKRFRLFAASNARLRRAVGGLTLAAGKGRREATIAAVNRVYAERHQVPGSFLGRGIEVGVGVRALTADDRRRGDLPHEHAALAELPSRHDGAAAGAGLWKVTH